MTLAVLVKGKLVGPRQVELAEPVSTTDTEVEVLVRSVSSPASEEPWGNYLRQLPPGHRTKADVDAQIRTERESWGDER